MALLTIVIFIRRGNGLRVVIFCAFPNASIQLDSRHRRPL